MPLNVSSMTVFLFFLQEFLFHMCSIFFESLLYLFPSLISSLKKKLFYPLFTYSFLTGSLFSSNTICFLFFILLSWFEIILIFFFNFFPESLSSHFMSSCCLYIPIMNMWIIIHELKYLFQVLRYQCPQSFVCSISACSWMLKGLY